MGRAPKRKPAKRNNRLKAADTAAPNGDDSQQYKRRLIADFCRLFEVNLKPAPQNGKTPPAPEPLPSLSPRMSQTLERLLAGDSEKQIAQRLGVSRHTVHVYVKALYRGFDVCSRGELLSRFVHRPTFAPGAKTPEATNGNER